jgi:hypothetical protein
MKFHLVDSPDAQQQVLDGSTLNLTAVTWFCPCRFAASLAAIAALAWLDFTLLLYVL